MSTIALLGNHSVAFSTERELDWTLENMGHYVIRLQEDKVSADEVVSGCRDRAAKLLIYVHTHGWDVIGDPHRMIEQLRKAGIKTASFHLDRFFGLNVLDKREDRIGTHAFWKTDTVFTADGGNQEKFAERGVNHVWMQPAVVERDCHFGQPSPEWGNQVIFAGSDGYHPEWPWRPMMVNRLREVYGSNFRLYQGIRQERLNSLYATARVVVGDHCFAGQPRYWSDRVPETLGRAGFLIHPRTEGLDIPGLVTYEPLNFDDLKKKIDYFLDDDHQQERLHLRNEAHEWVKKNATYTNRMQELLKVMNVQ